MAEREIRERDILVAANEFAYVQDLTKGDIVLYVGPTKISLSNTERLVELRGERFAPARPSWCTGICPALRGTEIGNRPDGDSTPNSTSAMAAPPRSPGHHA